MSERKFESFIEEELKKQGYLEIQYQGSTDKNIQSLLKSKTAKNQGKGKPEFILMLNGIASDLLVIELKKDLINHKSKLVNSKKEFNLEDFYNLEASKYACDGIIHYMSCLLGKYNVIGLGISGNENNYKVTTYKTENDKIIEESSDRILNKESYLKILKNKEYLTNKEVIENKIYKELPILHNELRDRMKLSEQEKPLLISALLIAIQDSTFEASYTTLNDEKELAKVTLDGVRRKLKSSSVPEDKINIMLNNFDFIQNNENVVKELKYIVDKIHFLFNGLDFSQTSYDIVGHFYNEFLKYTGGDKQGLGIVLTPSHITDLFCELVNLTKDDVVLDPCTGTGAFLISAMNYMINKSNNDKDKIEEIKKNQLIGIEQNNNMFTLGCSNMILRHDGKSNMFNGSCFNEDIKTKVRQLKRKSTVCFINPPYSQKRENETELDFIKNSLSMLEKNGKLVAIVPISTAIELSKEKITKREIILSEHTLEAVFSMPDDLFYPVGTNTCIMLFTAHKPHDKTIKSYFGYWKDDGFVKTKTNGRCDKFDKWITIKNKWIKDFRNKTPIDGKSAVQEVYHTNEWCAEAYMNVDYSTITEADFEQRIREYVAFLVTNNQYSIDVSIQKKEETI